MIAVSLLLAAFHPFVCGFCSPFFPVVCGYRSPLFTSSRSKKALSMAGGSSHSAQYGNKTYLQNTSSSEQTGNPKTPRPFFQQSVPPASIFMKKIPRPVLVMLTKPDGIDSDEKADITIETILNVLRSKRDVDNSRDDHSWRCPVDIISLRFIDGRRPSSLRPQAAHREKDALQQRMNRFLRVLRSVVPFADDCGCAVVVNGYENMDVGIRGGCHGVHLRETEFQRLDDVRARWNTIGKNMEYRHGEVVVGLSVHSLDVAVQATKGGDGPTYFLVGTAFPTSSHPEKVCRTQSRK